MSKQNKVNPGMYTQRGRLTQDDAARELRKQASIGSQHTWQPVQKDARPRPTSLGENANRGAKITSEDSDETFETTPVKAKAPKARSATKTTPKRTAAPKATGKAKTTKAKAAKAKTTKAKSARTVGRKAVLARNVGGGRLKARPAAKRRKS